MTDKQWLELLKDLDKLNKEFDLHIKNDKVNVLGRKLNKEVK
jgi:hypothetical protein